LICRAECSIFGWRNDEIVKIANPRNFLHRRNKILAVPRKRKNQSIKSISHLNDSKKTNKKLSENSGQGLYQLLRFLSFSSRRVVNDVKDKSSEHEKWDLF
jgi:hypothetical protein